MFSSVVVVHLLRFLLVSQYTQYLWSFISHVNNLVVIAQLLTDILDVLTDVYRYTVNQMLGLTIKTQTLSDYRIT